MILLSYCILLTAYQGDPSAFLYLASMVEWLAEIWMAIGWIMSHARGL